VRLTVARPARLAWQLQPPASFARPADAGDGGEASVILSLMEGERVNISCLAEGALPAPRFHWEESGHPLDADLRVHTHAEGLKEDEGAEEAVSRATDTWSMLEYEARLNHSGSNISCRVEQYHPQDGRLLYTSTLLLHLDIAPLVLPLGNAVSDQIGILSGILLAIILVVLLCTLLMLLMIRRDRRLKEKQKKYAAFKAEDAESLAPIWRPRGGRDPNCHNHHHHHFQFEDLEPDVGGKLGEPFSRRDR
jgi:hypothetical protein